MHEFLILKTKSSFSFHKKKKIPFTRKFSRIQLKTPLPPFPSPENRETKLKILSGNLKGGHRFTGKLVSFPRFIPSLKYFIIPNARKLTIHTSSSLIFQDIPPHTHTLSFPHIQRPMTINLAYYPPRIRFR